MPASHEVVNGWCAPKSPKMPNSLSWGSAQALRDVQYLGKLHGESLQRYGESCPNFYQVDSQSGGPAQLSSGGCLLTVLSPIYSHCGDNSAYLIIFIIYLTALQPVDAI